MVGGSKKILILGLGNILLHDEGLGVKALEYLSANYQFPPGVELLDGGTAGLPLINFLEGLDLLIVLDAVKAEAEAGAIFRFSPQDLDTQVMYKASLHQVHFLEVLKVAEALEKKLPTIIILAMQPQNIEGWGQELSPVIEDRLPHLAALAVEELEKSGVEVKRHLAL